MLRVGNETSFSVLVDSNIRKTDKHVGIYAIKNLTNHKVYVGQSVHIFKRINVHRTNLNRNLHGNQHLQLAWNKYGKENFTFEVLELCEEENLNLKEFEWIMKYDSADKENGYNSMIPDPTEKKFRHSEMTRQKLRETSDFSKEELLSALEEFFYMEGRVLEPEDRNNPKFSGYPKIHHYTTAFGSIGEALSITGLIQFDKKAKMRRRNAHTQESIIFQFQSFIDQFGIFPSAKEVSKAAYYNLPTHYAIKKIFGGYPQLRDIMGYSVKSKRDSEKEEALIALKKMSEIKKISFINLNEYHLVKNAEYYIYHFGSIQNAMTLAGITNQKVRTRNKKINYNIKQVIK